MSSPRVEIPPKSDMVYNPLRSRSFVIYAEYLALTCLVFVDLNWDELICADGVEKQSNLPVPEDSQPVSIPPPTHGGLASGLIQ